MSSGDSAPAARSSHAHKPRLGRGLSSLIIDSTAEAVHTHREPIQVPVPAAAAPAAAPPAPAAASPAVERDPAEIRVDHIAPNPYQPRRAFSELELAELADSIARQGVLQPLIVCRASDPAAEKPYTLIAGERRLRAAKLADLSAVPCVVRSPSQREMLEWALVENIHRADLNPIDRGMAYREYMDRFTLTQAQAAERLGQARATVANYLRLIVLPLTIQNWIASGELSLGHAKILAGITMGDRELIDLANRVCKESLSVRQLEEVVGGSRPAVTVPQQVEAERKTQQREVVKTAYIRDLEDQLTRTVGTRVAIRPGRAKNTGRLIIDYYNLDDFDRILGGLGVSVES